MRTLFLKFPCLTNGASVALTTIASGSVFFHMIEGTLGFFVLVTSAATSAFTCMIAIRRWYRGFKLEKLHRRNAAIFGNRKKQS
jgi:hypothetical protein